MSGINAREMTNLPGDDLAKAENILKRFYAQEALTDVDKEWMGYVKDLADGKISLEVYLRLQRSLAAVHAGETASQTPLTAPIPTVENEDEPGGMPHKLSGAGKPRIALIEFTNLHPLPEMQRAEKRLAANLEAELQQSQRFVLVARGELEHVLLEHHLSQDGVTQTLHAGQKLPSLEGLDYLVTGTLSGSALSTEATIKFITVGESRPGVVAHSFTAKGITTPAILPLVRQLTADIHAAFPLWGSVVAVQGERVTLSFSENSGAQAGDVVEAVSNGMPVGKLEIIEVGVDGSVARPIRADFSLSPNMRVRTTAPTMPLPESAPSAATLIGIFPFQNRTGDAMLDYIAEGIAETLTTMLGGLKGFRIIERQQLDLLLGEQRLQASALFDPQTAVETGKLWNARYLIMGGYQKLGEVYRLDGRRVDTESGEIFEARGLEGSDLFALQRALGKQLRESIERTGASSINSHQK